MKQVHVVLVALAVAVLMGGLTGCRSRAKRQAATQPGPMVQAPMPTPNYTAPPASVAQAPTTTYTQPSNPSAQVGTVVSRRVISRGGAPVDTAGMGSPDGMVSGDFGSGGYANAPDAFPDLPAPGSIDPSSSVPAITDAAGTGADLDVELSRLRDQLNTIRTEVDLVKNTPTAAPTAAPGASGSSLAVQFAEDLRARTGGEVMVSGSTVVVRVTDAFASGSNQLKKSASLISTLQATASALSTTPAASVEVVGHSDSTPLKRSKAKWGTNKRLSEARAQTVATELSRHGVAASRMDVKGVGSAQPLDASNSKRAHATNRRVEVVIRF